MTLEPIWEADFSVHSYGFRPNRSTYDAMTYLGKRLAEHYGFAHLDTGLLYRAVARVLMDRDIPLTDRDAAAEVALNLEIGEEPVKAALKGWGLDIVATKFAVHIMEPGLDKHRGLQAALRFMPSKVRMDEVLAIGDSDNDALMLQKAKYSGCVGSTSAW